MHHLRLSKTIISLTKEYVTSVNNKKAPRMNRGATNNNKLKNDLSWTSLGTLTATCTFLLINVCKESINMDCIALAHLLTFVASYASNLANLHNVFALVM